MATKEALKGLEKTGKALVEIKKQLKPFVDRLETAEGKALAQAQAAVALSVGTLRYVGARLRGLDQGRKADDPLRQELNEMRRVLTAVEKIKENDTTKKSKKSEGKRAKTPEKKPPAKRKAEETVEPSELSKEKTKTDGKKRKSPKENKRTSPSPKKRQRKR